MVLVWIAIGLGILVTIALIVKLAKTPRHAAVAITRRCEKCGDITLGVRCPKCDGSPDKKKFYT